MPAERVKHGIEANKRLGPWSASGVSLRERGWRRLDGVDVLRGSFIFLVVLHSNIRILAEAALLGAVLARWYTEPANRYLRARWLESPRELGAVKSTQEAAGSQSFLPP